jgi:hypothetical protein
MSDQKISQLVDGVPAEAGDLLVVARGGDNFRVTADSVAKLSAGDPWLDYGTPTWRTNFTDAGSLANWTVIQGSASDLKFVDGEMYNDTDNTIWIQRACGAGAGKADIGFRWANPLRVQGTLCGVGFRTNDSPGQILLSGYKSVSTGVYQEPTNLQHTIDQWTIGTPLGFAGAASYAVVVAGTAATAAGYGLRISFNGTATYNAEISSSPFAWTQFGAATAGPFGTPTHVVVAVPASNTRQRVRFAQYTAD